MWGPTESKFRKQTEQGDFFTITVIFAISTAVSGFFGVQSLIFSNIFIYNIVSASVFNTWFIKHFKNETVLIEWLKFPTPPPILQQIPVSLDVHPRPEKESHAILESPNSLGWKGLKVI